jgi:hypothetical protein
VADFTASCCEAVDFRACASAIVTVIVNVPGRVYVCRAVPELATNPSPKSIENVSAPEPVDADASATTSLSEATASRDARSSILTCSCAAGAFPADCVEPLEGDVGLGCDPPHPAHTKQIHATHTTTDAAIETPRGVRTGGKLFVQQSATTSDKLLNSALEMERLCADPVDGRRLINGGGSIPPFQLPQPVTGRGG